MTAMPLPVCSLFHLAWYLPGWFRSSQMPRSPFESLSQMWWLTPAVPALRRLSNDAFSLSVYTLMDTYQGWVSNLAIESSSQKPPWTEVRIYMHNTIFIFAALTDVVGSDQASRDLHHNHHPRESLRLPTSAGQGSVELRQSNFIFFSSFEKLEKPLNIKT